MRRLLIIALFLSLTLFGQGGAESYPPAPGPLKLSSPPQKPAQVHQPERQDDKRGTEDFPLFIKTIETQLQKTEKDRETKQREKEAVNSRFGTFFSGGLLLVAAFQLGLFAWQLNLMSKSMKLSKTAADAALAAANATEKQARANMFATRAYVRISSCSPGIIFFDRTFPPPAIACKLEIKNFGETPAHITDIVIQAYISEVDQLLPEPSDFTGVKRYKCSNAFLVRNASIFYQFYNEAILTKVTIANIKETKVILNLYGYVDYIDAFGKRHRGHFGQNYYAPYDDSTKYKPEEFPQRNNLTFLMQSGYNYDRERTKDEGNDWDYNQSFNPIRG